MTENVPKTKLVLERPVVAILPKLMKLNYSKMRLMVLHFVLKLLLIVIS